jgi:hypothetical protein
MRVLDVRLHLIADAGAQREVSHRTDVILDVKGRLEHAIGEPRIADSP